MSKLVWGQIDAGLAAIRILLNHCGEEGVLPDSKALNRPVNLRPNLHLNLWSWALGSNQKN